MSVAVKGSVTFAVSYINSSDHLATEKKISAQQKRVHARYDRRLLRVCCEYDTQWKAVINDVFRGSRRDIRPGGGGSWLKR